MAIADFKSEIKIGINTLYNNCGAFLQIAVRHQATGTKYYMQICMRGNAWYADFRIAIS